MLALLQTGTSQLALMPALGAAVGSEMRAAFTCGAWTRRDLQPERVIGVVGVFVNVETQRPSVRLDGGQGETFG